MTKVKLTKEQAEAIEGFISKMIDRTLTSEEYAKATLVVRHKNGFLEGLQEIPFGTLVRALFEGYEVYRSPGETLASEYQARIKSHDELDRVFAAGLAYSLEVLDVKIKGVNE